MQEKLVIHVCLVMLNMMWRSQASMRTLGDSELAISVYPTFSYNALGGGGVATCEQSGDVMHLTFDPHTVVIPDVNYRYSQGIRPLLWPVMIIVLRG